MPDRSKLRGHRTVEPLRANRPDFLRSGVVWLSPRRPPPGRPLPWWIYPNLTGPDTPCRSPVPSLVWKKQGSATLRYGSHFERTSLAHRDSLGLPRRAATRSLSRKKTTNSRTQGAFRLGAGNGFRRTAEPSRRAMTRLAHDHQRLFGLASLPPDQDESDDQLDHRCSPARPNGPNRRR